ncbi:gas vesicle protein GvpN [Natroniella sulfidigena]|uniref:gas vesicle protein GvpN n=1 Tax=Natroniella sulfidigena TaxID=723921 RepID=UPI00200B3C89|nr:gas vesicle protein GvpN [Natroniella sulfidigena]MCK8817054.1 gas vesicle protein GvpN [Natroniella sulfidigena]
MKLDGEQGIKAEQGFVETDYIHDLTDRSLMYLKAGYPVHFRGPAGTGKTTLALYLANLLDQPFQIIFGNEEFDRKDLLGGYFGLNREVVHDNFIHSVTKRKEKYSENWVDGKLLDACERGLTLIYDEFTRSRAETNNILLSILEEGVVELPLNEDSVNSVKVNPNFRVIFTSNPDEYSGVYKAQDALKSRMITMELGFPDFETEIEIIKKNTGISTELAEYIAKIVRYFRNKTTEKFNPTIRSSIMVAQILEENNVSFAKDKELVKKIFTDVLLSESSNLRISNQETEEAKKLLKKLFNKL